MSAMLCYYGMRPIYDKWQNTPTITSIEDTNYAVWNINFPAVTICSNNKALLLISLFFLLPGQFLSCYQQQVVKRKLSDAIGKPP